MSSFVSKFYTKRLLLIALVLYLFIPGVMAQNVSFADPDATVHKEILLYNSSGVLLNTVNTTTNDVSMNDVALVVFKPIYSNPLDEPGSWMSNTLSYLTTNVVAIVLAIFLISLLFSRR